MTDSNNWTDEDYRALAREGNKGYFRPDDWLCVAACESGLVVARPSSGRPGSGTFAFNKNGNASGLTQMMPDTLKNLGWHPGDADYDSVSGNYLELSVQDQVRWSGKYFADWRARQHLKSWLSPGDLYLANFYPAHLPHKDEPAHQLFDSTSHPTTYKQNPGFDFNDGSHPAWVDAENILGARVDIDGIHHGIDPRFQVIDEQFVYVHRKGWVEVLDIRRVALCGMSKPVYLTAVKSLNILRQQRLNECLPARPPLTADGNIGPKTLDAIRAFRAAAGIPLDGGFDAIVDEALFGE